MFELRNEGMLKLFFSELAPETRIESIRAMRAQYERKRAELRLLKAKAAHMPTGPRLTLDMGLDLMASLIEWCEAAERELGPAADRPTEIPKE